jgi:hypothetical protein
MQSEAGTLFVQGGLISEGQFQQALAAAFRHGCTLIQALVRLGFLRAEDLAAHLSALLEIPLAEAEQFERLPAFITKLVTPEVVMTHRVVPIMLHRGILHLAMSDPTNRSALEEISFLTGYSVSPVAASEHLVEAAMERYYGIPPDEAIPEMSILPGLSPGNPAPGPESGLPSPAPSPGDAPDPGQRTDIRWEPPARSSDVELEELFWGSRSDQEIIHLTRPKKPAPPGGPESARNLGEALQAEVLRALEHAQPERRTWPQGSEPAAEVQARTDARADDPPPVPQAPSPSGAPIAAASGGEPVASEDPALSPLPDSQEARLLIKQAAERDDIARVLVRYARTFLPRAVLLIIKKDLLVGWMGAGVGLSGPRVRGIMIPLDSASVFRTTRQTATDYFGSMPRGATNDIFLTSLGDIRPRQVLLIPISVRHKPICILYGDCAAAAGFGADLSPLHLMAQEAAQSFEKLILDRKIGRLVTR